MNTPRSVIVTPLDWGLGHATRCIPLIRAFLQRDWNVLIASSGGALELLKLEFPHLRFFEIDSYNVTYASTDRLLPKLLFQSAKFLSAIRKEHLQLDQILRAHPVDLVISDNRFGCYSKKVKSIFVTHQINFFFPFPFKWASRMVSFWNQQKIKRFDECWIPDFPDRSFSGKLSETNELSLAFVGPLSRFGQPTRQVEIKYDVAVLLSGPEPQRSIFEELVTKQLSALSVNAFIVLGKPHAERSVLSNGQIQKVAHLLEGELQQVIEGSRFVVCRSGYSSILDLAALQKKNIVMIPTPGQPEQEYLADWLSSKHLVYTVAQKDFDLAQAIEQSSNFLGLNCNENKSDLLNNAIDRVIKSLDRA